MKRLLTFLALLLSIHAWSQQKTISGTVTAKATQAPLAGVNVTGKKQTVVTDNTGHFSIQASINDVLVFSYVGMEAKRVKVTSAANLSVELEQANNDLGEIVVTGYQAQKKADLTGAVSVVKVDDIKDIPDGNPIKALQGRVPGVYIQSDGTPTGQASILIRGIHSINSTTAPLYVIDGVPSVNTMEQLNPSDIESIQILKDPSSASIYGSRANNGVIIITTKKGKKGQSQVQFDVSTSLQQYNSKLDVLNTDEYGKVFFTAAVNTGTDPNSNQVYQYKWNQNYSSPVLNSIVYPQFIDPAQTMKPANTNWFNEIAQTSQVNQYNLTISNGSEKGSSMLSVGYYDNSGVLKTTRTQKPSVRFNSEYNFFDNRLKVGENFTASYLKNAEMDGWGPSDVLYAALVQQPIVPVHTVTGGWGGPAPGMSDRQNPVRLLDDNIGNAYNFYRVLGNIFADATIIPNLHFRTNVALDFDGNYQRILQKSYVSGFLNQNFNSVYMSQGYDVNKIWQNTLNYDVTLHKNKLQVLLGQEATSYNGQFLSAYQQGLAIETLDYAYVGAGTQLPQAGSNGSGWGLNSYFGKLNYTYDNKYLASVTMRRDGSSRFGSANEYGNFPGFSLGWRLSEEKFMKKQSIVSDLKLRYGYGTAGNQAIANYATTSLYAAVYGTDATWGSDQGTAYNISGSGTGQLPSGFALIQTGNDSLKWETTKSSNFGIDFGLFHSAVTGSVDYFISNTTGLLINPGYIAVLGQGGGHWFNGASMRNQGIEIMVNYHGSINKDLTFDLTGNFSNANNKVTSLPSYVLTAYAGNGTTKTILGHDITSFYGYVADGLFKTQKDLDNSAQQTGKGLGRIRYKDLNGDGVIDQNDQNYIGNSTPKGLYGFNAAFHYKNFDFSFFFQGVEGITVNNTYKSLSDFTSLSAGTNWGKRTLDAWSPTNTGSNIPALSLVDNNNEGRFSTYFLESGSYLKLRNMQLGYNLKHAIKSTKIKSARVYIQGSNLLDIKSKSFTAKDPENTANSFPIPVIGTIGASIAF